MADRFRITGDLIRVLDVILKEGGFKTANELGRKSGAKSSRLQAEKLVEKRVFKAAQTRPVKYALRQDMDEEAKAFMTAIKVAREALKHELRQHKDRRTRPDRRQSPEYRATGYEKPEGPRPYGRGASYDAHGGKDAEAFQGDPSNGSARHNEVGEIHQERRSTFALSSKPVVAFGHEANGSFVVEAGSKVRKLVGKSFGPAQQAVRDELIRKRILVQSEHPDCYEFAVDYQFSSRSAAAAMILGRSANGKTEWKPVLPPASSMSGDADQRSAH